MESGQLSGFFLLNLLMVVPFVHLYHEGSTVYQCVVQTEEFNNIEGIFIDRHPKKVGEPKPVGDTDMYLQHEVYAREKRQRPFECITNSTDQQSELDITRDPQYQELVQRCVSQQPQKSCESSYKFRTFDGTCNNKQNWKWGSVFNCLRRFVDAKYEGVSGMRQSVCGGPLPEPRQLTLDIHQNKNLTAPAVSHMMTFFGQLVAHDVTDVPTSFIGDKPIDCCSNPRGPHHPQCAPILLPRNDPFYSKHNITCFNFVRSAICDTCSIGKRNQINQVTSYIDLSVIYGLNEEMDRTLRSDGTKLLTQIKSSGPLMPPDFGKGLCGSENNEFCFRSGDRRVNQHVTLMSLHTLFVREHNRIAEELRKINPDLPDDYIFQLARDINIAQMQVIVYKELLPALLGADLMTRYELWIQQHGCTSYDPTEDATVWVEFNTAAFRLHSMMDTIVHDYKPGYNNLWLRDSFNNAEDLYHDKMALLMGGVCTASAQSFDKYIANDMTNFMYKEIQGYYGFDIVSFNVQRGRDNGLPSYVEMVKFWSKGQINMQNFEDLRRFMNEENINALKKIYCDVRDIDLWVGMNNERVLDNTVVGPTAGEIIARQFSALKKGDRFYFEHCENLSFKEEHLETLKTVTLSSLLCLNTNIKSMQANAMLLPSEKNPVLFCDFIPKVDLSRFQVGVGR